MIQGCKIFACGLPLKSGDREDDAGVAKLSALATAFFSFVVLTASTLSMYNKIQIPFLNQKSIDVLTGASIMTFLFGAGRFFFIDEPKQPQPRPVPPSTSGGEG